MIDVPTRALKNNNFNIKNGKFPDGVTKSTEKLEKRNKKQKQNKTKQKNPPHVKHFPYFYLIFSYFQDACNSEIFRIQKSGIQYRLIFTNVIRCSRLRLCVGHLTHFIFTRVRSIVYQ